MTRVAASTSEGPERAAAFLENRVLIATMQRNDARLAGEFIAGAGLGVTLCADLGELTREIAAGCAALVIAEEVLRPDNVDPLVRTLERQPSWSEIPLVLVCNGGDRTVASLKRLKILGPVANVSFLERPFRPTTLVSTLEVALRSRRRQYEVRDLMGELARARDAAVAASRAKDEFLASLSHELRTPLSPVLLLASEAAADAGLPAGVRADFELIARNVALEARLIDDLLDLTRISRGKLRVEQAAQSLHRILEDAIGTVVGDLQENRLAIRRKFAAGAPVVMGDAIRLQQIFWNVLKNAVKFTPAGGTVTVETLLVPADGRVLVVISDTGMGIAADEIGTIFDAFVQGSDANQGMTHRRGGLGLGLAISKTLVELHGGTIGVVSEGRGRGAAFTVSLPLAGSGAV